MDYCVFAGVLMEGTVKPLFTANLDLPRTFPFPKTRGKSGFYCSCIYIAPLSYQLQSYSLEIYIQGDNAICLRK